MMRHLELAHVFVDHVPDRIEPGILYVSLPFGSAIHSCCCGCGEEVVTPITPTDWTLVFDGETVSLHPSIGNWTLPCRSHYVVRRGQVLEAPPWSEERIERERRRDKEAKARHFAEQTDGAAHALKPEKPETDRGFKARVDPVTELRRLISGDHEDEA